MCVVFHNQTLIYFKIKGHFTGDTSSFSPPHFSHAMNHHFPGSWIDESGLQYQPPRSPDFATLNSYHWVHMKDSMYKQKVNTQNALLHHNLDPASNTRIILTMYSIHRQARIILNSYCKFRNYYKFYVNTC